VETYDYEKRLTEDMISLWMGESKALSRGDAGTLTREALNILGAVVPGNEILTHIELMALLLREGMYTVGFKDAIIRAWNDALQARLVELTRCEAERMLAAFMGGVLYKPGSATFLI
jgi:hypothetical protein